VAGDRVFVSYSKHDAAIADAVCDALEASGRRCWIAPRDIRPSGEWAEQIIDGINAACVMVLIFSTRSNQSPQVRREVERAVHRDIPVVPFRIDDILPIKSLEYFLSTQHWFDAFEGPIESHVARLCALVEELADGSAHGAPVARAAPARSKPVYRDDDLAFLTRELARQIGPIARYLVERAASASESPAALVDALATEVAEPRERVGFIRNCRQRLGL
jgi:hypothetical protein